MRVWSRIKIPAIHSYRVANDMAGCRWFKADARREGRDAGDPGTGCEDHNGHRFLREAEFRPVSVTYIPRAAAFVEADPSGS